jgi:hypothetical protein
MPKGLHRYYGSGDLHFITCSCYHREPWGAGPPCCFSLSLTRGEAAPPLRFCKGGYLRTQPNEPMRGLSSPQAATRCQVPDPILVDMISKVLRVPLANRRHTGPQISIRDCVECTATHPSKNEGWDSRFEGRGTPNPRELVERRASAQQKPTGTIARTIAEKILVGERGFEPPTPWSRTRFKRLLKSVGIRCF